MNKIIAISGYPGSGKTSLMHELHRRMSCACLDYDSYQKITEHPLHVVRDWMQESEDYSGFVIPALADDLQRLKTGKEIRLPYEDVIIEPREYIFFETPLGREHKASGQYIDLLIWLDVPLDVALARNIRGLMKLYMQHDVAGEHADILHWLDTYLENYIAHIKDMLQLQYNKVAIAADITLDARAGIDSVALEAINKLSST